MTDQEIKEFVSKELLTHAKIPDAGFRSVVRAALFGPTNKIDWQEFLEDVKFQMPEYSHLGESVKSKFIMDKILEGADIRKTLSEGVVSEDTLEDYKKHYSGPCGDFDYDTRDWVIKNDQLSYIGSETDGFKIQIPSGVRACSNMFTHNTSLRIAPKIPNGVENCDNMFWGCTSLAQASKIPDSVKSCIYMFADCESLIKAPEIPNGVENCDSMFWGCKSLLKAPVIPNSVKSCEDMVAFCKPSVEFAFEWNVLHRGQSYYDQEED